MIVLISCKTKEIIEKKNKICKLTKPLILYNITNAEYKVERFDDNSIAYLVGIDSSKTVKETLRSKTTFINKDTFNYKSDNNWFPNYLPICELPLIFKNGQKVIISGNRSIEETNYNTYLNPKKFDDVTPPLFYITSIKKSE